MTEGVSWLVWSTNLALVATSIALAVSRRRGVAGTLAWIFAILLVPFAGAIAYLLLADPRVRRTSRLKRAAADRVRRAVPACPDLVVRDRDALAPHQRSLLEMAARLTGLPPTPGNRFEHLTDNTRAFARKEEAIRAARHSVWAEYYIISDDETGRRFLDLLAERARDGLDVRLLYDAVGSAGLDAGRIAAIRAAGGKVAAFLPVNPLRRRWAVHLRNHRKLIVVDGEVALVGGMNVGDDYSGSGLRRTRLPWRDTHFVVVGPAARDLAEVFDEDWCFATWECLPLSPVVPRRAGSATVAVLPSGPDQEVNAIGLIYFSAITAAVSRCYVTGPYFIPDEPTLQAITSAAYRGVDVRVLIPARGDVPFMFLAIRSYYPALLEAGVRIFEYEPAVLHTKTLVVDGILSLIGSANLDIRSFRLNFEAGALVFDPELARTLEAQFEDDLTRSREVTKDAVARRGFVTTLAEGTARLLSPLL